jgi:hypothetical protein
MKMPLRTSFSLMSVLAMAASSAGAAPVTWQGNGHLTSASDPNGVLGFPASVGEAFALTLTFAADAPVLSTADQTVYLNPALSFGLTLNGHAAVFGFDSVVINIAGPPPAEGKLDVPFSLHGTYNFVGPVSFSRSIGIAYPTSNAALPFYWEDRYSELLNGANVVSAGRIEGSFGPAPVPLPDAVWLFLSGLGAVGSLARKQRSAVTVCV